MTVFAAWIRSIGSACVALIAVVGVASGQLAAPESAAVVKFHGYDDCIRLENATTRVTLCPQAGGRVLEYALNGKNALYLPPGDEGWVYKEGGDWGSMNAGRFDIGPEQTIPQHPLLWSGKWTGEITGKHQARLTSQFDRATGVQLVREFTLDAHSSRLDCKQIIINRSDSAREYCHWSRTFALGGGICMIPLSEPSRFPNGYVMYEPNSAINFRPEDPQITKKDGFLLITGAPREPKLGMDTAAGWFAYLMKNDIAFVKRFSVDRNAPYNEVAGLTMSIWYPKGPMCELEPIGPRQRIEPGEEAAFTETWELIPHKFPQKTDDIRPGVIAEQLASSTEAGFETIFNGRDLKGWHRNPERIGHGTGGSWRVVDGVIVGEQDPPGSGNGGILLSDKTYADFEVVFEAKPDWGPDSGFFMRSNEKGQCFQMMLDYHEAGNVGEIYREGLDGVSNRTFDLFGNYRDANRSILETITARPQAPRTANQVVGTPKIPLSDWNHIWRINDWNTLRCRVEGNPPRIQTWINGAQISDYTSDKKFEAELGERGHIAFQVHGGKGAWPVGSKVRFRNVRIKELSKD